MKYKPAKHKDESHSREIEEEEPEEDTSEQEDSQTSITGVRDRLNRLHSLVEVCLLALVNPDFKGTDHLQKKVADVLLDFVGPEIQTAEEELRNI